MGKLKLLNIILSLFDGGAAGGNGAGAPASGQGDGSAQGGTQASPAPTRRGGPQDAGRTVQKPAAKRRGAGETQQVLYGKQAQPEQTGEAGEAGEEVPSAAGKGDEGDKPSTLEERRKAYRALVEGEFKDLYTEDTQRIIDRRFRQVRSLEEQVNRSKPVLDLLMERYQISDGDPAKLMQAVENDEAYWTQAAEDAGMSVEQYKKLQRLQQENKALRELQMRNQAQQKANQTLQQWYSQADELKKTYPSFDLAQEVQNPQFLSMLRSGVPIQHAFEVIHMDDIKAGVAAMQAKATERQLVSSIRAKGSRPQENGTSSQSGFTVKDDVTKLSRKDRAEIARRAARGETITF